MSEPPHRTLTDADCEAIAQRVASLLAGMEAGPQSRRIEPNAVYSIEEAAELVPVKAQGLRAMARNRILKAKGGGKGRPWRVLGSELLKLA